MLYWLISKLAVKYLFSNFYLVYILIFFLLVFIINEVEFKNKVLYKNKLKCKFYSKLISL